MDTHKHRLFERGRGGANLRAKCRDDGCIGTHAKMIHESMGDVYKQPATHRDLHSMGGLRE